MNEELHWLAFRYVAGEMPADEEACFEHRLADDLRTVHQPPQVFVESLSSMHDALIIPKDKIAGAPFLIPGEALLRGMRPDCVEQRLAFLDR